MALPLRGTVILVPGFLASSLGYYHLFGTGFERGLWLNPAALLGGAFPLLALPLPDQPDLPGSRFPLIRGGPMWPYYGLLDRSIEAAGYACESPTADWRYGIDVDGRTLADFIERWAIGGPVQVVCHSRGGLLTRWALDYLSRTGKPGLVKRVVGMGVPHRGSLNAVINLAGHSALIHQITELGDALRGYVGTGLGLGTVRQVLRSWPALYQLLPDPVRTWLPPAAAAALYDPSKWAQLPFKPYTPHLQAAAANWANLPDPPAGVEWIDVAGYGGKTLQGLPPNGRWDEPSLFPADEDGDGTVPFASALIPGRRKILTPCAHDMLPNDGRLYPHVLAALAGELTADQTVTGAFFSLPG